MLCGVQDQTYPIVWLWWLNGYSLYVRPSVYWRHAFESCRLAETASPRGTDRSMTLTIRRPRLSSRCGSARPQGRKPNFREKAEAPKKGQGERSAPIIEKLFYLLFLSLPFVTLIQTVLARTDEYTVTRPILSETLISGPRWAYRLPFAVKNKATIEKLIQCESRGMNVSRPDSDGIMSDGILQFHRGPTDTLAGSTWEDFSQASGITGSPNDSADAIRMTDWAISHGLGPHWTCWRLQKLSPGS